MPFTVPTFLDIRTALLRDIANLLPEADTGPDSDFFVRSSSVASAVEGLYQHQSWIVRQIFPDTADSEYLELHARVRGLSRKPAVSAAGLVRFTGMPGTTVPLGQAFRTDSQLYVTTATGVLDSSGQIDLPASAQIAGTDGNLEPDTVVDLSAVPAGIDSQATIIEMTGGTAQETDAALLARLLELIRRPPAGGNKYDYRRWALEVPGVSAAYVYPLRRGLGTVDVVITADGDLPSMETIAAVQTHIDEMRPVTAKDCLVLAPTPLPVDILVKVSLTGLTLAQATQQIETLLGGYFGLLAPGETALRSRIEALISDMSGVVDRVLINPATNIIPTVDERLIEWPQLGAVEVQLL